MKKFKVLTFGLVFGLMAALTHVPCVRAAIIHVPADRPTIQAGINAATIGDTVLVSDGTYSGEGNNRLDFKGKKITVQSENGPSGCIVDCQGSNRGFSFQSGETNDSILDLDFGQSRFCT